MKRIDTSEPGWQKLVHRAMKAGEPFLLETLDPDWDPTSSKPIDIAKLMWGSDFPRWVSELVADDGAAEKAREKVR